MSKQKYTDAQYLQAGGSYFEGDDFTSNHTYQIVKTRKEHDCMGVDHKGNQAIPSGSKALCEKAIHADCGRVSCYVCLGCLDEWCLDLFGVSEVYYVDCINACRANPDDCESDGGDSVICSECGEPGIIYDLRESSVAGGQTLESASAVDFNSSAPQMGTVSLRG